MTEIPWAIRPHAGREPRIDDPVQRIGYRLSLLMSAGYYGPQTCDWQLKANQVVLNEATADYLYTEFSPTQVSYQAGSRPVLEKLAGRIASGGQSDRERVLGILDYVYRGYRHDHADLFPGQKLAVLNAQEEEIPKLGHVSCECHSRLTICLCNIIGLPARYVSLFGWVDPDRDFVVRGGHTMTEVLLEGKWSVFDSDWGFFCQLDDGRLASIWELVCDPSLVDRQRDRVYSRFGKSRKWHGEFQRCFLSPYSVRAISNYSVNDWLRFDWNWIFASGDANEPHLRKLLEARDRLKDELVKEYRAARG